MGAAVEDWTVWLLVDELAAEEVVLELPVEEEVLEVVAAWLVFDAVASDLPGIVAAARLAKSPAQAAPPKAAPIVRRRRSRLARSLASGVGEIRFVLSMTPRSHPLLHGP